MNKNVISRNRRLEKFTCQKCHKEFTHEFEEFWHWVYSGAGCVCRDTKGEMILDEKGYPFVRKGEWKLKPYNSYGPAYTRFIICPFCDEMQEVNLNKKEYRYLRRSPPTEREIRRDVKEDWR